MTTLKDYDKSSVRSATVSRSLRITPENVPEVRSISLRIDHPDFSYSEGQHVGVIVPGPHEFGHDEHFRLYTIANSPLVSDSDTVDIELCVRRCFYIDEFSGELEPGIASNYLCDLRSGDSVSITGPYGGIFKMPEDPHSNLLMIGSGTGIAPFRAFIQHVYHQQKGEWHGELRLYYGARSGAENLYRNDQLNDMDKYYDQKTFHAFEGVSQRPWMSEEDDGLHQLLDDNAAEIWQLIQDPKTYLYLAGLHKTRDNFEHIMLQTAESKARWRWTREEMIEQGRWSELIY